MVVGRRHHAHRTQDAHCHRQIEPRAFLLKIRRRQINGHRFIRIAEARIEHRAFDTLAALAHRQVRHADSDEITARAGVHVNLDVDKMRVDAKYRGRARA